MSFTTHVGGVHELCVFLRHESVDGSPFALTVHAGRTAAAACDVDTSRLTNVCAAVPAPFAVIAYDRHRNRALRGGDQIGAFTHY